MKEPRPEQIKRRINWEQYDELVKDLAQKIQEATSPAYQIVLYGIPRGGALLSYLLSYYLKDCVVIGELSMLKFMVQSARLDRQHLYFRKRSLFLVDDIVDDGQTLCKTIEFLSSIYEIKRADYRVATLYKKIAPKTPPDIYAAYVADQDFVVFPYEKENNSEKESVNN